MSTPMKSLSVLFSPRTLSPLSPVPSKSLNQLSVPKDNIKLKTPQDTHRIKGENYAVKKLVFSKLSPTPKPLFEPIKLHVTDYGGNDTDSITITKSDIVIDTPNKKSITNNGLKDNRYLNVLGIGRFGKVVRGVYKEEIVAVKVVKNAASLRETNALHLNHKNVVKTIDIVEKKGENFSLVVMEYFPNSSQLQSLLENLEINLEDKIIPFAKQICEGVNYCHDKGVLHLDIKPQNILVCGSFCKLCDFGNSVRISDAKRFNHQGTIHYTAPELLQGECPTIKCDVYSLGILLWQLRTRINPYLGTDNTETIIYKVVKCNWRPENDYPRDKYAKLYHECWNPKPGDRPPVPSIVEKLSDMS